MKNISIENYKCLKNLRLNSLRRVNLIVGMNNSGKSTLLEAISIFAANGEITQLKKVLENRGIIFNFNREEENAAEREMENFSTLFTGLIDDSPIMNQISLSSDISNSDTQIVSIKFATIVTEEVRTSRSGEMVTKRRVVRNDELPLMGDYYLEECLSVDQNHNNYAYLFGNRVVKGMPAKRLFPCEHVLTSDILSKTNPVYFDNIALGVYEKELINALRIIEPTIENINFLKEQTRRVIIPREDNRVPYVICGQNKKRQRLSTMGDGINRILSIVLAMLNCENGVFLIDEFDNGLHYSVQTKLWRMIYHLAERLNIQVFATTHSDDCIKSFIEADENSEGKLIRLENRGGEIVAVSYEEKDELEYIATSNIEVR
ncbi:MAG: AAA family ATPase [Rikenellaceae bacterium]